MTHKISKKDLVFRKDLDGIKFQIVWPEDIKIICEINWTDPYIYDAVLNGGVPENDEAYFYSIVAESKSEKDWYSYYIGMAFENQYISDRFNAPDHKTRRQELEKKHPNKDFMVCLGTPTFKYFKYSEKDQPTKTKKGRFHEPLIKNIESLLIYTNHHDDLENKRQFEFFKSNKQFFVKNIGFTEHLMRVEIGYGIFGDWREDQ
jgi:hypothetical protein